MDKKQELISIIIPTYNSSSFIDSCLESVIKQTYTNWEIIIIDQMSSDNTLDVVKKKNNKKIKIFLNSNVGNIASSRNIGINNSNANLVAFLDSDDIWLENKLEDSVAFLGNSDLVYHNASILKKDKTLSIDKSHRFSIKDNPELMLTLGNPIITSSVVCKKKILNKIIQFSDDRDLVAIEDYDLWVNLAFDGANFKYLNRCLCIYRHHDNNISNIKFNRIIGLKKIFAKYDFKLAKYSKQKANSYLRYLIANILFLQKDSAIASEYLKLLFSRLDFSKKIDCIKKIIKIFFR